MKKKAKNPAAVALGRKGGMAATRKLDAQQRRERASAAAKARWGKATKRD